jgi:hypothetical protein
MQAAGVALQLLLALWMAVHVLSFYGTRHFRRVIRLQQYLSPEKDPEYKAMVKPSLLKPFETLSAVDLELSFPEAKVGDVVVYAGKLEDKIALGRIRDLQSRPRGGEGVEGQTSSFADVVPLKEGKSDAVYVIDRGGKSSFEAVDSLKPVRSYYVRAENGYRVAFRGNSSSEVVFKAPKYRVVGGTFELPNVVIGQDVPQEAMGEYAALKARLMKNTFLFGAVGAVGTTALYGPDVSVPYIVGVAAGLCYLYLLGKKTDNIGLNMVQGIQEDESKLEKYFIDGRYLAPVLLMGLLAALRPLLGMGMDVSQGAGGDVGVGMGFVPSKFHVIAKSEFLGAVAGFLTYMVALIVTEVGTEVRANDVLSILPGSVAETFRQAKELRGLDGELLDVGPPPLVPLVLVTGPRAAGRSDIVREVLVQGEADSKAASAVGGGRKSGSTAPAMPALKRVKFLTTSENAAAMAPNKYTHVDSSELERLREEDALVYEGEDRGFFDDAAVPIYLAADDLLSEYGLVGVKRTEKGQGKGKDKDVPPAAVQVIEGSPELLLALSKIPELQLINVWVSLQTKEQFIEKASEVVKSELSSGGRLGNEGDIKGAELAKRSADEVGLLVNEAARDITFYMSKAPLFEYTLLNSLSDAATAEELLDLLRNVL